MDEMHARLRRLPAVDELLRRGSLAAVLTPLPRAVAVHACRAAIESARSRILAGEEKGFDERDVVEAAHTLAKPSLRRVLNLTGVVLHTNLGRAPLAPLALERIQDVARGYSSLELDLESGERGSRYSHVIGLLTQLTGAESALVVNNGAAAALLALGALASGKEVVVSRGELVEIGGGFRVPDVLRQSGATLVEVGTTNRTRAADFESAIGPSTGLLLKVHQSNFAVVGFTEAVTTKQLATLAHAKGLLVLEDLGSGALVPLHAEGLTSEPTVASVIAAGADVVTFSGDKLLGGPQAGIIVGTKTVLERLERHPLNRALRVDKLTVAALEATLELYRDGRADAEVPVRSMLAATPEALLAKAEALARALDARHVPSRLMETVGQVGGGSMPLATPRSFAVALDGDAERLSSRLRQGTPPVVARVSDGALLLDVRCLELSDVEVLAAAVAVAREGP